MPPKVSKIKMVGFRGATCPSEIPFDTDKSITLIFGENGTGKSTIVDAFDFICNKAYGSLDNYSLGEPSKKHAASLGFKPTDVKVDLTCGSSMWSASLGKEGPAISPSASCPDARILRRKKILDFIEEQPKKRYEALKTFIALPGIEKSENALREAIKTVDAAFNEAVRALGQANDSLTRLWTEEGKPGKSALIWANKEAGKDIELLQSHVSELIKLDAGFQTTQDALSSLDNYLSEQKKAEEALAVAESKQKEAERKQAKHSAQLVKLLQDARSFITQKGPLSQCPVCEREISGEELIKRLTVRIDEMKVIDSLALVTGAAKTQVVTKKTIADQARNDFCKKLKALSSNLKLSTLEEVRKADIKWELFNSLLNHTDSDFTDEIEKQGRELWVIALPCKQVLLERKNGEQKSVNQHNAIKEYVETLNQNNINAKKFEVLSKRLKAAIEVVSRQRRSYVETILGSISLEVEKLYTALHPGEGIGKVRFFLKPNAIGSLEFDAQFHNIPELPPQAYYSESHLDTLGICVFLALSKRFKTDNTIIILDDVLTSVDGAHLDRFMDLLHTQAKEFNQVIVTTHYRLWRDRYRWAKGPTANTQVIELGPWTLNNGLQTGEFLTAVTELQKSIAQSKYDRQAVASKAGIILESLLDFITLRYRCALPRNARHEYTLGDLAAGVDNKLSMELKVIHGEQKSETILKPMIDACVTGQWIRNSVGCHFAVLGSEVSDTDVKSFCDNVLALASKMICSSCGTLPTKRPSGSYWQCKCGELQLYPLIYPGSDPAKVGDEG